MAMAEMMSSYAHHEMLLPFALVPVLVAFFFLWCSIGVHIISYWACRKNKETKTKSLPTPPGGLPIIGHLLHLQKQQPHVALHDLASRYDDGSGLMLVRLGAVPTVVVSSAWAAREILRTHDHNFASRPPSALAAILFSGPSDVAFVPYGEQWRQSKRLVTTHLLTASKVRSFRHARLDEVRLAMSKIRGHHATDMSELLYSFANDVVCRAVSGKFFLGTTEQEGRNNRNQLFRELIGMSTELLGGFNIQEYFPFFFPRLASRVVCGKAKKLEERWHDLLDRLIDAHTNNCKDDKGETDFIHVLLSLQREYDLTRNQMKAILINMFGAGTDTSYITMEYALVELVQNPHVMDKLQAEVRTNTPEGQDMVTEDDLNNMTYLKAVIKETLRLHPPTPLLLPHHSMADCDIHGYMIPARTRVMINAWAISRDPRYWDRAEEFVPERFITTPNNGGSGVVDFKGTDFQFTPFGAGRRICPGINFGLATVEAMLANLVYRFDWELPTGMAKEDMDMTELFGLTVRRNEKLILVPRPFIRT